MDFGLSDEQRELKQSARDFLAGECPTSYVRKVMASEEGTAPELYKEIAKLGWTGLAVPESHGGAGLSMLDMAVLLEEQGYAAMPGPFLFSSVLATMALSEFGSEQMKQRWLPALAEGKATGTIAIVEEETGIEPTGIRTSVRESGGELVISGRKMLVPYAHVADFVIVAARTGPGPRDLALVLVERNSRGVETRLMKHIDLTRRVCALELAEVRVSAQARLEGAANAFDRMLDAGAVAVAADSLGGSQRSLDMAVEYSKVREQFGKPIGSFQALKHLAAEMVSEIEPARSLLWYAAYAHDALREQAPRAAAMAKARLSEIYSRTADRAVLMHGGIGFTWEHDMHLWFKRSRFNESYFGSPAYHRERVAVLGGY